MKTQLERRSFLGAAGAGLLVLPGRSGLAAASERVRVAVIGLRSRGTDHARLFAASTGAEVAAVCDVDDAMFDKPVKAVEKITGKAPRIEKDFRRLLDDPVDRRGHDRHARPLARDDDRPGVPGRQRRLCRKAGQPQRRRGAADGRGRSQVQPRRAARNPAAEHALCAGSDRARSSRSTRQSRDGPCLEPSKAGQHRPWPARAGARRASTTPCGKGRHPTGHTTPTACTTTGTGSGTGGPASWGITAFTVSTSPAGGWASMRPSPSVREAASTSSTTTRKRPIRRP